MANRTATRHGFMPTRSPQPEILPARSRSGRASKSRPDAPKDRRAKAAWLGAGDQRTTVKGKLLSLSIGRRATVPARSAHALPAHPTGIERVAPCLRSPAPPQTASFSPLPSPDQSAKWNAVAPVAQLDRALPSEAGPGAQEVPSEPRLLQRRSVFSSLEAHPGHIFQLAIDRSAAERLARQRPAPIEPFRSGGLDR